jgi:hypothetical protein
MTISNLTIKIDLRADADAEAARIRAVKARPADAASTKPSSGIPAAVIRRPMAAGLARHAVIFFTRTRIVDGSGRLVEERVIPVEVSGEIHGQPQKLFERWRALVRSVCLAEVARRMADLASEYRHGLQRARTRESQLADMARADRDALVQPSLFDRRALNDRVAVADDGRPESLATASSLLVAQQSETILLLIIS